MKRLAGASLLAAAATASGQGSPDPYRPLYHFAPLQNWINDPNGLVHWRGEWHLFFQLNPRGAQWGHMSWGHAVSRDLMRWEELPVALVGDEAAKMYFSGSALVDRGADPALVAVYTAVVDGVQRQEIAWSSDRGRTWSEDPANPVIDLGSREFRDPKVFWYEPDRRWIMVVSRGSEKRLQLFGSTDLRRWEHLSDFGPDHLDVSNWECPDLFELAVEGETGERRWLLQIDVGDGAVAGGSGGRYLVGDFDGVRFTPDTTDEVLWVDHGPDFYAAQSWSNAPEGRRVWIAWMSNWSYASATPTGDWRGAMTIPREVGLRRFEDGIRLVQRPVPEVRSWRGEGVEAAGADLADLNRQLAEAGHLGVALDIEAELEPGTARSLGLAVRQGEDEETRVGYDAVERAFFVDRTRSGETGFHSDFAGRFDAPLDVGEGPVRLRILTDASSVEVFAQDGRAAITTLVFPRTGSDGVSLFAEGGEPDAIALRVWRLRRPPEPGQP